MLVKLGSRHFSARVREHLLSDRPSNVLDIYRVQSRAEHPAHGDTGLLREILDSAATKYQEVKHRESMFIKWEKSDLMQPAAFKRFREVVSVYSTTRTASSNNC